jgi:hypothetical protein
VTPALESSGPGPSEPLLAQVERQARNCAQPTDTPLPTPPITSGVASLDRFRRTEQSPIWDTFAL